MRCPICSGPDTQVKDSRPSEEDTVVRRRRECSMCGDRFTTYERPHLQNLIVQKSDGRREDFEREKLVRSISIAMRKRPFDQERINQMVSGIIRQLEESSNYDIPSETIGRYVMNTLSRIDTVAFVRFASVYKNFQEADDFESFVAQLRPTYDDRPD